MHSGRWKEVGCGVVLVVFVVVRVGVWVPAGPAGVLQANVGQKLVHSNIFKSFFYRSSLANYHVSDA